MPWGWDCIEGEGLTRTVQLERKDILLPQPDPEIELRYVMDAGTDPKS
jgi:hypothetical protein